MGAEGALIVVILIGLGAAGLTLIVRALLPIHFLAFKPWSCDLCCSFWGCAIGSFLHSGSLGTSLDWKSAWWLIVLLPAVTVSVVALKTVGWLRDRAIPEEPPELPPL